MTRNLLVSIVTPSYNQASFLEETIQSVLSQTYPNVEYIIIDGGSKDGSQEIIRKYETRLAYHQSKKDNGMADAINQGWKIARGDILAYLNSDDVLEKDAVEKVVRIFMDSPDADVVYGDAAIIDDRGKTVRVFQSEPFDLRAVFETWNDPIRQPSAFLRKSVWNQYGGVDESFQFCPDFEYWIRIAAGGAHFRYIPEVLSRAREHADAKSFRQQDIHADELIRLYEKFRSTPAFANSGVKEKESFKEVHRVASEHYIYADKKWKAFQVFVKYSGHQYSGLQRVYRILRYIARLMTAGFSRH